MSDPFSLDTQTTYVAQEFLMNYNGTDEVISETLKCTIENIFEEPWCTGTASPQAVWVGRKYTITADRLMSDNQMIVNALGPVEGTSGGGTTPPAKVTVIAKMTKNDASGRKIWMTFANCAIKKTGLEGAGGKLMKTGIEFIMQNPSKDFSWVAVEGAYYG